MVTANFIKLYDEFRELTEKGDETNARQFLIDHFAEFPEDVQGDIVVAFFEEAITDTSKETEALDKIREDTLEEVKAMEKLKRVLEDRLKVLELESKI